jgi:ribosomal protein S18 acetylase RimI-like enzyme
VSEAAIGEGGRAGGIVITTGTAWGGERRTLATLLYDGYAAKAAALQIDRETALAVLADALNLDCCLVAVKGGAAVGVVGLVERRARALEFPFALLRRRFGVVRAVAYSLLLRFRSQVPAGEDEIVFEALAVAAPQRNRGIGARLVVRVEDHAREKGYRSVSLDVTDSNHGAIRLYSRLGYSIVRTRRYPFVTRRAGFGGSHHMRKRLPRLPCPDHATS